MVQMMYYMMHKHHVLPSVFHAMKTGELIICRAFMLKEIEDKKAAEAKLKEGG